MAKLDASEVAYAGREGLSRGSERLRGHPGARENEGVEMHVKHWSGIGWSADIVALCRKRENLALQAKSFGSLAESVNSLLCSGNLWLPQKRTFLSGNPGSSCFGT